MRKFTVFVFFMTVLLLVAMNNSTANGSTCKNRTCTVKEAWEDIIPLCRYFNYETHQYDYKEDRKCAYRCTIIECDGPRCEQISIATVRNQCLIYSYCREVILTSPCSETGGTTHYITTIFNQAQVYDMGSCDFGHCFFGICDGILCPQCEIEDRPCPIG